MNFIITNIDMIVDVINSILIFLTLLAIIWYSWETLQLKKEAQKQNKTSIQPYLSLLIWFDKARREKLLIRNVGKGIATRVSFKLLDWKGGYAVGGFDKGFKFYIIPALTPKGSTTSFLDAHRHFSPVLGDKENYYSLLVSYLDIEGNYYYAIFKTNLDYNDKFEIIEQKPGKYEELS